jgi:hypothetical protein
MSSVETALGEVPGSSGDRADRNGKQTREVWIRWTDTMAHFGGSAQSARFRLLEVPPPPFPSSDDRAKSPRSRESMVEPVLFQ